jgi:glucokinase
MRPTSSSKIMSASSSPYCRLPPADGPRLLADIGGTNARFALETAGQIEAIEVLACADYPSLAAAASVPGLPTWRQPAGKPCAMARSPLPIPSRRLVRMTNHHWAFSIRAMRESGFTTLVVVNDFTALARSLPQLSASRNTRWARRGVPARPLGLIGAGTASAFRA